MDELTGLSIAVLDFNGLRHALTLEPNMTLYYWAMFVWVRIVGIGADEATLRLPSAIFGAASVPLVYVLGRRLHSRAAGLLAAGLLAINPYHVVISREARSYPLLSSLTVLSYLLLDHALQHSRLRTWVLHGLVNGLAFYCHFYAGLIIVAQALFVLSRRSRSFMSGLLWSGLVTGLLLAQLLPRFLERPRGFAPREQPAPTLYDIIDALARLSTGPNEWPLLLLYAVLCIIGLASWTGGARPASYRNLLLFFWLTVPLSLTFLLSQARPILFRTRYLFEVLPSLPLLAGVGLARLPRFALFLPLSVISGWSLLIVSEDSLREEAQWREAVAYASANAGPDDGWIFISRLGQNAFEYYAGWGWGKNPSAPYANVLDPFEWRRAAGSRRYRWLSPGVDLDGFEKGHPRIWLVVSHAVDQTTGMNMAASTREWLRALGYEQSFREFKDVRLWLFQRSFRAGPEPRPLAVHDLGHRAESLVNWNENTSRPGSNGRPRLI